MSDGQWLPQIDTGLCHECGLCIDGCDPGALGWDAAGKAAVTQPERCLYCGTCEANCPTGAIELPYLICFTAKDAS